MEPESSLVANHFMGLVSLLLNNLATTIHSAHAVFLDPHRKIYPQKLWIIWRHKFRTRETEARIIRPKK